MNDSNALFQILIAPRVTEKGTMCQERGNQVLFKVARWANKPQIKAAVEKMFDVQVVSVQTMHVHGKKKQVGRLKGRRQDWKKAVVRLEDGQSIDFFANT